MRSSSCSAGTFGAKLACSCADVSVSFDWEAECKATCAKGGMQMKVNDCTLVGPGTVSSTCSCGMSIAIQVNMCAKKQEECSTKCSKSGLKVLVNACSKNEKNE